ncbi:MAG TPA: histidinol dehydrogenase [Thermomicrobiales bacterium]|nr:histidinol dehydrogenase [Thermomicrobiales bacterium]
MPIRIFTDLDAARRDLLARRPPGQQELSPGVRAGIRRVFGADLDAAAVVERILADVRREGDAALRRYTAEFDGARLDGLVASEGEIAAGVAAAGATVVAAMRVAAERIEAFHRRQVRQSWVDFGADGALGQVVRPLARVGLYVPGGTAAYPSSLLMSAIPARVAGVGEIVVATPPGRDGALPPATLAAARVAGVHRIVKVGGAQAIGALAYGTASVPRVDKIFGPGNLFVALAKARVYGQVAIDQIAGPTETLIVADDGADPALVAADLLAQAEHDPLASAILLTTSAALAERVRDAIEAQLPALSRREIIAASLAANGGIAVVPDLATAIALANDYAPEHLCLVVRDPWALVESVRNAGGIFLGAASAEVMGDYVAGPSHVMPTGGTARFSSPLNVEEFVKVISLIGLNDRGLRALGPAAATLAECEGLTAHAAAVRRRGLRTED